MDETRPNPETNAREPYQAPGVEVILTAEDLEREVLYAGPASLPTDR